MTNPETSNHAINGKVHNGFDGTDNFIEELVEKCAENPRYVFKPEVVERLASLKQEDRLAFETIRVTLKKKIGFRLTALDEVIANSTSETDREPNQAEILMGFEDMEWIKGWWSQGESNP